MHLSLDALAAVSSVAYKGDKSRYFKAKSTMYTAFFS